MIRYSLSSSLTSEPEYFPEQDLVAGLDVERDLLAFLGDLPVTRGDHLALLGLLLRRIGDDDPALLHFLLFEPLDQNAIV